jgi:hypothetical protein
MRYLNAAPFVFAFLIFSAVAAAQSCNTGADAPPYGNCNGIIEITELDDYINAWYMCSACVLDLYGAIAEYFADCGDGTCNFNEDCSSCPGDCGSCQPQCLPQNNCYYVSVSGGTAPHDGTAGHEYTLDEAQSLANSRPGDELTFMLLGGNYGSFTLNDAPSRTVWVNWKANEPGVVFTDISVINAVPRDSYLRFEGVKVHLPDLNYASMQIAVAYFLRTSYVQLINCTVTADEMYSVSDGILFESDSAQPIHDFLVKDSHMYNVGSGVRFRDVENIVIDGNEVHDLFTTAIGGAYGFPSNHVTISNNHVYDMRHHPEYKYYDWGSSFHASSISVRGHDYTIMNNRIHESRHGIHIYYGDYFERYNILIENNLMYAVHHCFSIYNAPLATGAFTGPVIIRKNTIIGDFDPYSSTLEYNFPQELDIDLSVGSYDGTGSIVEDNIIIGHFHIYNYPGEDYYDPTAAWEVKNNLIFERGFNSGNLDSSNTIIADEINAGNLPSDFVENHLFVNPVFDEMNNPSCQISYLDFNLLHCSAGSPGCDFTPKDSSIACTMSSAGSYVGAIPCGSSPAVEQCTVVGDEDENGLADCEDPACIGNPGPSGKTCCNTINECGTCQDCMSNECNPITATEGKNCPDPGKYCDAGTCCDDADGDDVCDVAGFPSDYISYWKFDETGGTTAYDENTANANDGSLMNGAAFFDDAGERGRVLSLDGLDDYVDAGNDASLNLQGSLTMAAWIKPDTFGLGSGGRIAERGDGNTAGYVFYIYGSTLSSISYFASGGTFADARSAVTTGQWQHVAVVYDQSAATVTFYKDGSQEGSPIAYTDAPPDSSGYSFIIGNRLDLKRTFDGLIDDLMVYGRALSADEIQQIYSVSLTQCENDNDNDGYGTGPGFDGCLSATPDCDNTNQNIHPDNPNSFCDCDTGDGYDKGRAEQCDGNDDDCDGEVDGPGICPTINYYCDTDVDGSISQALSGSCSSFNCMPGECQTSPGNDCDDSNPDVHPGAQEICDGVVNDCPQTGTPDDPLDIPCSGSTVCIGGQCCIEDPGTPGTCSSDCTIYVVASGGKTSGDCSNALDPCDFDTVRQSGNSISAQAGDIVCLKDDSGDYGDVTFGFGSVVGTSSSWITYKEAPGEKPVFDNLLINRGGDAYLRLEGITIRHPPGSYSGRVTPLKSVVTVSSTHNVHLKNCTVIGVNKYWTVWGIKEENSDYLKVEGCDIYDIEIPVRVYGGYEVNLSNNHIHDFSYGSGIGIMSGGGSTETTIAEGNYIHNMHSDPADPGYVLGHGGAGIAIKRSNTIIRGNTIHDVDGEGMYIHVSYVQKNHIIENNLVYDTSNYIGFNVDDGPLIIRDNTFIGWISLDGASGGWTADDVLMRYALQVQRFSVAFDADIIPAGYDGTGTTIENNIILGRWEMPLQSLNYLENNNLWWVKNTPPNAGYGTGDNDLKGPGSRVGVWMEGGALHGYPELFEDLGAGFTQWTDEHTSGTAHTPLFVNPGYRFISEQSPMPSTEDSGKVWDYRPLINGPLCNGGVINGNQFFPGAIAGVPWAGAMPCACTSTTQCVEVLGSGYVCDTGTEKCV